MRLLFLSGAFCLLACVAFAKEEKKDKEDFGTVVGIDLGTTYSWYGA